MWSFGIFVFLINISPESLQLTAIAGVSQCLAILLFGALIGDIVDTTPRLKGIFISSFFPEKVWSFN